jgi:hypothetical protein
MSVWQDESAPASRRIASDDASTVVDLSVQSAGNCLGVRLGEFVASRVWMGVHTYLKLARFAHALVLKLS